MMDASYRVPGTALPKFAFMLPPHSPLAVPIVRSQSGKKLPGRGSPAPNRLSFHVRLVVVLTVFAGLLRRAIPIDSCCTPRLALALMAVLPLPNRSYAAET